MILTILDARGVQSYIYGSNRLRDNIGASELVHQALSVWPCEELRRAFARRASPVAGCEPDRSPYEPHDLDGELLYAGGGNAVLLFPDLDRAWTFARAYSLRLLRDAPGLEVTCVHRQVDGPLAAAFLEAQRELAQRKAVPAPGVAPGGLGVTLSCVVTGRAANVVDRGMADESEQPIAREVAAKRDEAVRRAAEERIEGLAPRLRQALNVRGGMRVEGFALPVQFRDLGGSPGEMNRVGVVHLDGNGVGQRFLEVALRHSNTDAGADPAFIEEMRALSAGVKEVGAAVVRAVVDRILDSLTVECGRLMAAGVTPLAYADGTPLLPLRFLVYGGDDLTFVCDGRLTLDLAACALEAFETASERRFGPDGKLTACAGVAVVKTAYPFARAYALAEALCRHAKQVWRDEPSYAETSLLDWHVMTGGVETDVRKIRERGYRTPDGNRLTLRPYPLGKGPCSWGWLRNEIVDRLLSEEPWSAMRNQLRGSLAAALRAGKARAKAELDRLRLRPDLRDEPLPGGGRHYPTEGFDQGGTPYLDALELMDLLPVSSAWSASPAASAAGP